MTLEEQLAEAALRMNNSLELAARATRIAGKDAKEYQRIKDLIDIPDLDDSCCTSCGAMAGCCKQYPNCPGNPEWKPPC